MSWRQESHANAIAASRPRRARGATARRMPRRTPCSAELKRAQRPLVLVGPVMANGRGRAARERLAAATGVPVVCMESPRGVNDPGLGAFADVLQRGRSHRAARQAAGFHAALRRAAGGGRGLPLHRHRSRAGRAAARIDDARARGARAALGRRRSARCRRRTLAANGRAVRRRRSGRETCTPPSGSAPRNGRRWSPGPRGRCTRSKSAAPCSRSSTARATRCWSPTAGSSGNGRRRA